MHWLLIDIGKPLDASFCEAVVKLFGQCEVIPLTENYSAVEGFRIEHSLESIKNLLQLIEQHAHKAILADVRNNFDTQMHWLQIFPEKGLLCDFEPPEISMFTKIQLKDHLWCLIPWDELTADDFD